MNYAEWLIVSLVSRVISTNNYLAIQVAIEIVSTNRIDPSRPKIVGGYEIKIHEVPFLLALHQKTDGFVCGAVILSARWGMSALHCISPDRGMKNYFVRAGSSINLLGGTVHRVEQFFSYNSEYFDGKTIPFHDIVLFRVRDRFRFSKRVRPAKLPLDGTVTPKLLRVSGWGRTDISTQAFPLSLYLRTANVTRVTWKDCMAATSWYESIVNEKNHLCYGEENTDACYGDSGGPLADSQTVYGIVSFGDGCGISPGIYTKVSHYRRWIWRITRV